MPWNPASSLKRSFARPKFIRIKIWSSWRRDKELRSLIAIHVCLIEKGISIWRRNRQSLICVRSNRVSFGVRSGHALIFLWNREEVAGSSAGTAPEFRVARKWYFGLWLDEVNNRFADDFFGCWTVTSSTVVGISTSGISVIHSRIRVIHSEYLVLIRIRLWRLHRLLPLLSP